MSISIDERATCATCRHFDHSTPNPFVAKNGNCTATCEDGLPPILPLVGVSPDRPACRMYGEKGAAR